VVLPNRPVDEAGDGPKTDSPTEEPYEARCVYSEESPDGTALEPAGATDGWGITLGQDGVPGGPVDPAAAVTVDVFFDYICPYCELFEAQLGPQLDALRQAGSAVVVVHPLGYLDVFSTTDYSSRAAQAAVAVAAVDPARFDAFDQLLWANQPDEGGPGLSDQDLADLAALAGVSQAAVDRFGCPEYGDWVVSATAAVQQSEGFPGTPWVLLGDGTAYYVWDWSKGDLAAAVANVAAGQAP
jgi:protein-disulfide isomerase